MVLFKDFIHKMTYRLLALFLLSFSIGAMDENENIDNVQLSDDLLFLSESEPQSKFISQVGGKSLDKGFEIEWKEITFQDVKFRGTHTTEYRSPNFKGLAGIKGKSINITPAIK